MSELGAISPEAFAQEMGWGVKRVRRLAKKLGACRILGNRMALLPEDVQTILEHGQNIMPVRKAKPKIILTPPESAIYFIAVRGFIKIGWTINWRSRISNIQSSNPEPIEVLLILGRPKIFERTMHQQFAEHRTNGEWFRDHPDIRAYIAEREHECWYRAGRKS